MNSFYVKALLFNKQMGKIAELCKKLNEDETFVIESQETILTFDIIKDYLDTQSRLNKRFVVFNYPDKFVVMRIVDNSDIKAMYKFMALESESEGLIENNDSQQHCKKLIELNDRYLGSSFVKVKNIDPKITKPMFIDGVITYGWLQRSTSAAPLFKNTGNATKTLKDTLWAMVENGTAQVIDGKKYGTMGKLYKINGALDRVLTKKQDIKTTPRGMLELEKQNQLAYVTQELEKLYKPFCDPIELPIKDDIIVTYLDIRHHLDNLSQGEKRYTVDEDKEEKCFRIARQLDNSDLSIFYKKDDKEELKNITEDADEEEPCDLPERKDAHQGFKLADDYMKGE